MTRALVIGGGVMGLAIARELRQRGFDVRLLERDQPGRAASWASAGIIGATVRDEADPSYQLRRTSYQLWPAFAARLIEESHFDPEYRENGCLYLAADDRELEWLHHVQRRRPLEPADEVHSRRPLEPPDDVHSRRPLDAPGQVQVGALGSPNEATQLLDQQQLRREEPALSHDLRGGLFVPGGNVDPRRLCRALELAARNAGVRLETGVEVRGVAASGSRVTGVTTRTGQNLAADVVILAAGAWSSTLDGIEPKPPIGPQRGQILALDQAAVGVRHVLLTPEDPYFVPRCDGRLVVGATREEAGWDASLTAGGVAWLLQRAMSVVPALRTCAIAEMWTGFRPNSADGLPLIGRGALDGLYYLTGHGPSGISPLPGSVALLAALIAGEAPPIDPQPFSPLRFPQAQI